MKPDLMKMRTILVVLTLLYISCLSAPESNKPNHYKNKKKTSMLNLHLERQIEIVERSKITEFIGEGQVSILIFNSRNINYDINKN